MPWHAKRHSNYRERIFAMNWRVPMWHLSPTSGSQLSHDVSECFVRWITLSSRGSPWPFRKSLQRWTHKPLWWIRIGLTSDQGEPSWHRHVPSGNANEYACYVAVLQLIRSTGNGWQKVKHFYAPLIVFHVFQSPDAKKCVLWLYIEIFMFSKTNSLLWGVCSI
jgi:hypothetical protein